MTNLLNSLVEFTKSDYAYVQPDSPEADAVFIDSIMHRDGKVWISNELHEDRRTSFSNADFETGTNRTSKTEMVSWQGTVSAMSSWTSSATTIMADSIANSAKYVQSFSSTITASKSTPYASMTPSVIKACKEGEHVKRHSIIPSLYGATSDSLDTYDGPYDPISRSIFMVDHPSTSATSDRSKRMRRRFTTDVTDAASIVSQSEYPETSSERPIPNNSFKRMSDLFNFSSSASSSVKLE